MDQGKKDILILIGTIIAIISLIAIILGIILKDDETKNTEKPNNDIKISKDIEILKDENTFFKLQNTINNYYNLIINRKTDDILKILDKNFIDNKQINKDNLYSIIDTNFEVPNFVAKNIYYNPNSTTTYYFINGYLTSVSMMEDNYDYKANINFMIVVDEATKYYEIRPLDITDIYSYAKGEAIIYKDIKSKESLSNYRMDEENKLAFYINEFLNLMFLDTKRAYEMLDENTLKKYNGYEDFNSKITNIYDTLSTSIFAYATKKKNEEVIYQIKDNKQNNIIIYESSVMNYKIGF